MSSTILIDPNNLTKPLPPHPDHLVITSGEKDSIGIEEIRELIKWAHRKPFESDSKRVLIRQAQYLTEEAQNALLKILEEPPERTKITLSVSHIDHLLPTVKSRCTITPAAKIDSVGAQSPRPQEANIKPPRLDVTLPSLIQDAFSRAAKLAQLDRREIVAKLDQLILQLREQDLTLHWKSIKTITVAQRQVRENVNVRLALENMFLKLLS